MHYLTSSALLCLQRLGLYESRPAAAGGLDYLAHIVEAVERIYRYTDDVDELAFMGNQLIQDAVIRNLEIIGEASHNIETHYPDFVKNHPELPLVFAYQMRNAIAHGYFKVDFEIVWNTIHRDLPSLHAQIQSALRSLN